jgi:tape measure domain-containing protein
VSVVANVAINVDSSGAVGKLRQVQTQAQSTEKAFGNVAAAVGKLAVAFGAIQAARFVFAKTAELESQTRSLQVLAGSAEKAGKIIKELQDLGAVTPFTSTELIDSAKRLQAFGVEADKVVETTRRLADASGATGAELSGLVTAYGQVQAKGRLQGEELLQFQERGIALQEELRKMYGMTGEEFQKALSKGQVSAKAVEVALVNLTSAGGKYANGAIAQSDTLQGRLSTLQDGIDGLARGIGTALSPAIKAVLNEAIFAVNVINNLIATGARAKNFGLGDSQRKQILNQAQTEAQQIVEGRRIKDPFERNRQFQELAGQRERDLIESYGYSTGQAKAAATAPQMAAQVPGLLGATAAGGGGSRAAAGGAGKAANDAKRAAEQAAQAEQQIQERLRGLIREVELIDQIAAVKELQFQAEMDGNKELQIRLQGEERIIQIMQSTAQALDDITDERLKQNILAKAESEIASARLDTMFDMQRIEAERAKSFDAIIAGLDLELALKSATTEQAREQLRLEAEIAKLRGQGFTPEQIGAITAKKTELAAPKTDQQNITEKIGRLKDEIADLTSISNIAITSAEGIGNAFAQSFQGLISGTMTAKEALGSFFKSVADMFLEMAAQIIAKQITMIILQTILKALGGAPGGGAGLSSGFDAGNASALPTDSAGWNQSFATKLPGRAMGGPVSSGQTYMVGERGPELFVPGTGGSVVNNSDLRSAMGAAPGAGGGSPVLNMSFQSTSINGVEYVSREQLEQAMAETRRASTRDGAKRGMTMTLDRIQNSSSTRRKVGI